MKPETQTLLNKDSEIWQIQAMYCSCFSSDKRLYIFYTLTEGEKSVGELAEIVGLTQQNVSQHLRIMKDRGVVTSRKVGQTVYYRVKNDKFIKACQLIQAGLLEELAKQGKLLT